MNVSQITHIIFDWDGTVMDSAAKIVSCMQQAAKLSDLPVPLDSEVRHIIGISLLPAIKQLFDIEDTKATEVKSHYKNVYLESDKTPCPLFEGVNDVLTHLHRHYTLGVATGKARRGLLRAFEGTSTAHYFDASKCADDAESKPSPDMLKQLLEQWNISPEQAVMVGDTIYDMQMAEQIGMPRIGVSYGVHNKEALLAHSPIAVIDNITELPAIFK